MDILVVLEDNNGKLHRMSKEAIVAAQKIGGSVSALAIGKNSIHFAAELKDMALSEVLIVNHESVSSYSIQQSICVFTRV